MRNPLVMLSALVGAGALAISAGLYFGPDYSAIDVHFDQGRTPSQVFMPPATDKEDHYVRHPNADGSAVDDVWMRDGTTKRIVYDTRMVLRQVSAFYPAPKGQDQGALKYTKEHNADGHLSLERHLRPDGSLEMDGRLLADNTYSRNLYFPSASPDAAPVVSSLRVFNAIWKPLRQTDYRPDATRETFQLWNKDGDRFFTSFAANGVTALFTEITKSSGYKRMDYVPGGDSLSLVTENSSSGTSFTLYRDESVATLKVTFVNTKHMQYTIMNDAGKPVLMQDWAPNYSGKPDASGNYPLVIEAVTHYDANGKLAVRYFFAQTGQLTAVIQYQGDDVYGPRKVYTVDPDGYFTKVMTFTNSYESDKGVELPRSQAPRFAEDPAAQVKPTFVQPTLKDGLKLWGEPPHQGPY